MIKIHEKAKPAALFFLATIAMAIIGGCLYQRGTEVGADKGFAQGKVLGAAAQIAAIRATCEDEAAPTVLAGKTFMCVSKEQWNKVLNYVFTEGVKAGRGQLKDS